METLVVSMWLEAGQALNRCYTRDTLFVWHFDSGPAEVA